MMRGGAVNGKSSSHPTSRWAFNGHKHGPMCPEWRAIGDRAVNDMAVPLNGLFNMGNLAQGFALGCLGFGKLETEQNTKSINFVD